MAQDGIQHASKRPQDRPKTAPIGHGAFRGDPQEACIRQKLEASQCVLLSRLVASPQNTFRKRGPEGLHDGPQSAQERLKNAPRGPKRRFAWLRKDEVYWGPPFFDRCPPQMAPKGTKRAPRDPQEGSQSSLNGVFAGRSRGGG